MRILSAHRAVGKGTKKLHEKGGHNYIIPREGEQGEGPPWLYEGPGGRGLLQGLSQPAGPIAWDLGADSGPTAPPSVVPE